MNYKKLWILLGLIFALIIILVVCTSKPTVIFQRFETPEEDLASTNIDSQFSENAAGWLAVNGESTWSVNDGSLQSTGLEGKFTSSKLDMRYTDLTYIIRFRRTGSDDHPQGIIFYGNAYPTSSLGEWNSGYTFDVTNNSYFIIGMYDNGEWTALTDWTYSPKLTSWWNIFKITAHSTTGFTQFFINGERVAYGNLTTFDAGLVGFGFFRESSSQFFVDYAQVNTWAPESDDKTLSLGGILVDDTAPVELVDVDRFSSP